MDPLGFDTVGRIAAAYLYGLRSVGCGPNDDQPH
jgi:hypothetical protein